tara:strand:+ start:471 stop:920 length:450 start_codon:yes stop_codon:yes gene_type:complete
MIKKKFPLFIIIMFTITFPNYSFSHNDNPRHKAMMTLGKTMKQISSINKSGGSFEADDLNQLNEIFEISKSFNVLFANDDSGEEESRASPKIWTNKSKFINFSNDFEASIAKLINAVNSKSNEEVSNAIAQVGANCGKCHRVFRLPKKN